MKQKKSILFLFSLCLSLNLVAADNNGNAKVKISLINEEITSAHCDNDKAPVMYQGETVEVQVDTEGLSYNRGGFFRRGGLTYTYYWSAEGFEPDPDGHAVNQKVLGSSYTSFKIPKLDSKTNATNMIVGVKVRDIYGTEASNFVTVKVWRPFYLSLDTKTRACYNILPSEQISGIYTNNSNTSRTISIQDNESRTVASEYGQKRGFTVSLYPTYYGAGLLGVGFSKEYFSSMGRSVQQSSSTTISTELLPNEAAVFFRQLMFVKNHFYIMRISRCAAPSIAGHAFHHNWVSTYPVTLVDLTLPNPLDDIKAGVEAKNSCDGYEERIAGDNYNADAAPFIPTEPIIEVPFEG
ncbi:MAG: hypothetical protein HQK50_09010 [Oligoflexia bacterium]|nr:hypothetical protein [Oligoflexia bacterium]MBF0365698.1 hypothetical protein [Oligoflexia bacterium]